jgi:AcrR family transcriptional regulator
VGETEKRRGYHSPRRQQQAEATQRDILRAARRLFAADGYVTTTLSAVAVEAGVSLPTVTAAFGTKLAILDALIRVEVRGDEASTPLAARPRWQEMLQEPNPVCQLRLCATNLRHIHEGTTDIFEIVRGAATAEPEIATLRRSLNAQRLEDKHLLAESLKEKGALRSGLTVAQATDLLWALGSADMYRMLVADRGWSPEQYEEWLASSLVHSLLGLQQDARPGWG